MSEFIATVSAIVDRDGDGNPATARVLPRVAGGVVTMPFAVYWPMRAGGIREGDEVICLQFEDGSGLVLSRPDGSFGQTASGSPPQG